MDPLALSAFTVTSALGRGLAPTLDALLAERSGLRQCDFAGLSLDTWIGRIDGVEDEPIAGTLSTYDCRNNRLARIALRQDGFENAVAAAAARYGTERIAVILGTTTSGVLAGEEAFANRDPASGYLPANFLHSGTVDHYSLTDFVARQLGLHGPAFTVSTACSSSAKVFGDAAELLHAGFCDAAVVGGADSLCKMALRGFTSLELVSRRPCRPNDATRDGISIGEAAGFVLLERASAAPPNAIRLLGCGNSCDAYHMSSPDPDGRGAALAIRAALADAGISPQDIDYVHQHGTGTQLNDRIEDAAIASVISTQTPCSSTKGWTGHTLGAAGVTNAVLAALFLAQGLLPRNLHLDQSDPTLQCQIQQQTQRRSIRYVLSNAFGFGGSNCCLVLGITP